MTSRTQFRTLGNCGAIILMTLGLSCNRSPTSPSAGPNPSPSAQVTTVRLEITAPASIAPGTTGMLRATAILSDSTVTDVTDRTKWSSGDQTVLQVAGAVVTGVRVGEAMIHASYQAPEGTRYGVAPIVVLLPGTFKLGGRITDAGIGVRDAAVTVRSGVGAGLSTRTQADGRYALYGVAGRVGLEVTRGGYLDRTEEIDVQDSMAHDLALTPDRARAVIAGAYTLTITMGACSPQDKAIPLELRHRRYDADLTQDDSRLTVALRGADFVDHDFAGTIDPVGQVTFTLGDPGDSYLQGPFDVVERFGPTDVFIVWGTVDATMTPSGLPGTLTGALMVAPAAHPTFFSASAYCWSTNHVFELQRK